MLALLTVLAMSAQKRKVQNRPYIDLRPMHFGILIGFNMQDAEFDNVGPQTITLPDGSQVPADVQCDVDIWNPGFSVGVLADVRLHQYFSLRVSPTMHFGGKRVTFRNVLDLDDSGKPRLTTQDMKNTYLSVPIDLKFYAERFNNYRPYVLAGFNPMLNLAGKDQEAIQLKRFDATVEVGLGCDFYLPFFKLIPELKFCYGLSNALDKSHLSEIKDPNKFAFASSVSSARTKMIMLTLYFE
jgi:hypothetical protein